MCINIYIVWSQLGVIKEMFSDLMWLIQLFRYFKLSALWQRFVTVRSLQIQLREVVHKSVVKQLDSDLERVIWNPGLPL